MTSVDMNAIWDTDRTITARMQAQKVANTRPEVALRRLLHRRGLRFRLHRPVPGMPRRTIDIAFVRERVAVFVDGCFWHACPKCYKRPKTNSAFWEKKREDNMARDRRVANQLRSRGWKVIRIWEHALRKSPRTCVSRILRGLSLDSPQSVIRSRVQL